MISSGRRRGRYSESAVPRQAIRGRGRVAPAALPLVLVIAVGLGACSVTFPFSRDQDSDVTGAISLRPPSPPVLPAAVAPSPLSPLLDQEDWRRARAALAVALDPQGNGSAVAWDNPASGSKGSFTPVGSPYLSGDEICRAFVASVAVGEQPTLSQGNACRVGPAEWSVRDVKPWKRPA